MAEVFDVAVIGMGVGGEEVAGRAADAGLEVLAVERKLVGGECPYWGCIPSKMMLRAALSLAEADRVGTLAGAAKTTPSWRPVSERVREATAGWDDTAAVERHEDKGTSFVRGAARVTSHNSLEVDGRRYETRRAIVIAAGGEPSIPPIDGLPDIDYWTNREAIEATQIPRSLLVFGGGPIGVELAQVYNRFGASVTVIEMAPHILPLEEPENGQALAEVLQDQGITVVSGVGAKSVAQGGDGIQATLEDGQTVSAQKLLVATGRRSNLDALGVASIGLDADALTIEVDEHLRAAEGVWAVGDITGKGQFTHVAVYQGRIAAADILGDEHEPADYRAVPRVTFTDPEVASVGLSQAQAHEQGLDVAVGTAPTSSSARGWIHGPGAAKGVAKLIADRKSGVLVGGSVMGPAAGEVIGLVTLAVKQRIPVAALKELIYPYPTFVRGLEDALGELG